MKHRALAALGLLVAACAHDERPATPSASAVDQATDVPPNNPDFTPPANQVGETNDAGVQPAPGTTTTDTFNGTSTSSTSANGPTSSSSNGPTSPSSNGPTNTTSSTASNRTTPPAADNSDVNDRDRARSAVTPMDQGESEADRTITQQIRQAVMKDSSLSFNAKNVKIITLNRKVTLRGPVKNDAERSTIEAAAKKVAGVTSVDNQLEVAK